MPVAPDGVRITREPLTALGALGGISIAFTVERVLEVKPIDGGLGGFALTERALASPFRKDYDAEAGEGPSRWAERFDVSRWGLLAARAGDQWVGGAVIAMDTPGVVMLEDRRDLAVLWDLRVSPAFREQGTGTALFEAAEQWAEERQCRRLKVETQNINVPACRFYARRGCSLGAINRFAYPDLPGEVQLLWYKTLPAPRKEAPA